MPKLLKFILAYHAERYSCKLKISTKQKKNEMKRNEKEKNYKSERYFIDGPSMAADIIIIVHNDRPN